MKFRVEDALMDGFERAASPEGAVLVASFFGLYVLDILALPMERFISEGPVLDLPLVVVVLLAILYYIGFTFLVLVSYRTFANTRKETISRDILRHRIGPALLSMIGAYLLFTVLIGSGVVLLVTSVLFPIGVTLLIAAVLIPIGVFLLVGLWFFDVAIAVDDETAIDSFERSLDLTAGNRLGLFLLGMLVSVVWLGVGGSAFAVGVVVGGVTGEIIASLGAAVGVIFAFAVTVTAYEQLLVLERGHPGGTSLR